MTVIQQPPPATRNAPDSGKERHIRPPYCTANPTKIKCEDRLVINSSKYKHQIIMCRRKECTLQSISQKSEEGYRFRMIMIHIKRQK